MDTSLANYLNYVEKVLGVKQVLNPDLSLSSDPNLKSILILVENLSEYSEEEKQLLHKMIQAMKFDQHQLNIKNYDELKLKRRSS